MALTDKISLLLHVHVHFLYSPLKFNNILSIIPWISTTFLQFYNRCYPIYNMHWKFFDDIVLSIISKLVKVGNIRMEVQYIHLLLHRKKWKITSLNFRKWIFTYFLMTLVMLNIYILVLEVVNTLYLKGINTCSWYKNRIIDIWSKRLRS